jgi:glycosyltransferase involved in cell wall biosynthesis
VSEEPGFDGPVALVSDTSEFAGAELYLTSLVESLRGRCSFVALLPSDAAAETRARLAAGGAEVRHVRGLHRRPSPMGVRRLVRELRAVGPAIVHANLTDQGDGRAIAAADLVAGHPLVATLHLVVPARARWRELLSALTLRRFDCVVAVSASVAAYLGRMGARATVVRNGVVPANARKDARAALGLRREAFVVGGIGRLHRQKGWDVLCRAAAEITRDGLDAEFVVVGDGPDRAALIADPECARVRFLGYRPRAAELIAAFDVLAVPSRFEGFGLTALEGLFQGVPVVASNIDPLAEVLGDSAVLVPPEDPASLARAIGKLAAEPAERSSLAERGRRRAQEHFTAERMGAETLAVYRTVAAGANLRDVQAKDPRETS